MKTRHAIVIACEAQARLRARGIKATALARALDISRQSASRILNRGIAPTEEHMVTVERAFGIPMVLWRLRPGATPTPQEAGALGDTPVSVTWKSQGQAALLLCAHPAWESSPPRLWSTTPAAVARACGVLEAEVTAWVLGDRTPTSAQRRALERHAPNLPAEWWTVPPPESAAAAHVLALFMGLRAPSPGEREHFRVHHGIAPEAWDQPAPAA